LRAARVVPGFVDAARVALVETSPVLRQSQKAALSGAGVPVQWHDRLDDVAPDPTILIANEFFDALGVRQFVRTDTGWHERLVGLDASGKLAFGLAPDAVPADLLPRWTHGAGPGELVEVSPARHGVAQALGARLATMGGAALIIDYGHVRSGPGDTLQAVRAHGFTDVLESPGESDITSHVDFEALGAPLALGGAVVHGPLTQSAFLSAMGLAERAEMLERHADPGTRVDIRAAATRLAAESQMGQLFKVIAATHPDLPPPYPFQDPGQ
jgi:NADH dehydrogenase [ubiquinone] 1 alpha subcomplex assembly factor 7